MKISSHKELKVWQTSMDLVEEIYLISKKFPPDEKFGLISQMRRCAISIPSNIAEGAGRFSSPDFRKFLYYSMGSCSELETQVLISKRIGYLEDIESILNSLKYIKAMLSGLIKKLQ